MSFSAHEKIKHLSKWLQFVTYYINNKIIRNIIYIFCTNIFTKNINFLTWINVVNFLVKVLLISLFTDCLFIIVKYLLNAISMLVYYIV